MATLEQDCMMQSWLMRFNDFSELGLPSTSSSRQSLQEEIGQLRLLMVQVANQEQSFTSEQVIEISALLDKKINEYMGLSEKEQQPYEDLYENRRWREDKYHRR